MAHLVGRHTRGAGAVALECPNGDIECAPWAACLVDGPLPCSNTVSGNVALFLVYALLIGVGSFMLSKAIQKILQNVRYDTVVGRVTVGIIHPVLTTLPDLLLVIAAGIASSNEDFDIQDQMFVGAGVLTGSTILWLTLGWSVLLVRGRCDLKNGEASDGVLVNKKTIVHSGVTTDSGTRMSCIWTLLSAAPYLIIQISAFFNISHDVSSRQKEDHWPLVATFVACYILYFVHTIYLLTGQRYQHRMLREAQRRRRIQEVKQRFMDNLSRVRVEDWSAMADREMPPRWEEIAEMREQEQRVLGSGREVVSWRDQIVVKVGLFLFLLVGGIALLSIFSWPMVITLMRLSNTNNTLKHSQFYISAFLLPFVTDGSEVAELLRQAKHKNRKAVSLLYCSIFVGVTTRSTLVLGCFAVMLFVQDCAWLFTSPTLVTLAVVSFVATLTAAMRTLPTYWAIVIGPVVSIAAVCVTLALESEWFQFD